GDERSRHAADGRVVPALRILLARGLHHTGTLRDRAGTRAVAHPPPIVPGALLPVRRGARGTTGLRGSSAAVRTLLGWRNTTVPSGRTRSVNPPRRPLASSGH